MQHFIAGTSTPIGSISLPALAIPDWQCEAILHLVSKAYDVPAYLLLHPTRCMRATARARQLAMYLVHVVLGRDMAEVGKAFGRDRTTVSYACAKVEDMRDDPGFDAELADLERRISDLLDVVAAGLGHVAF